VGFFKKEQITTEDTAKKIEDITEVLGFMQQMLVNLYERIKVIEDSDCDTKKKLDSANDKLINVIQKLNSMLTDN
jgi:hypothetical protein